MAVTHRNRVKMTVSGTPGTGTITLGSASSGFQSFASAYGGNATVDVLITDGTAWEVARGCAYTNSGATLTRGALEASSTGSAISLTSAAVVSVIATAGVGNMLEATMEAFRPGGRLTLTSGTPVTTSDVTGATTIYYVPYVSDVIALWDGVRWVPTIFTETSHALGTVTSGRPYDVFGYLSGGALALEKLAWTNDTTRATAVTLQDGRYCKSGDKTRLLLGTFYSTSTTATEDSQANRYVSNVYNDVARQLKREDSTSHTYATSAFRTWNGGSATDVAFVSALPQSFLGQAYLYYSSSSSSGIVGLGVNGTQSGSLSAGTISGSWVTANVFVDAPAGRAYLSTMEYANGTTNFGNAATTALIQG